MAHSPLGRTLVIANPAAHSGKGATGAEFARHFLTSYASATKGYEIRLTASMGDAVTLRPPPPLLTVFLHLEETVSFTK